MLYTRSIGNKWWRFLENDKVVKRTNGLVKHMLQHRQDRYKLRVGY